ncbi:MAG: YqgE/AlgH family protein [Halofilum sp. (in: g-proteobacteria)]|nr:YqgE/AlgH family protein [Halofilum sp. (in: g-proteobacteria)]
MELTNHFLLAMPTLEDPNFHRTLTYVCEHSEHGAMGLVVNRPLAITVGEVLRHLEIEPTATELAQQPVYQGGPVETERGFILHAPLGRWEGTLRLSDELGVTTSRDILEAMAQGAGPEKALVTLGYSGWGAGQLEAEVAQNAWLTCPASSDILFEVPPEERLVTAAARMGIDLDLLSSDAGHA